MSLLNQYFLGYRVSFLGSFVGFFYGFFVGGIGGVMIGWILFMLVNHKKWVSIYIYFAAYDIHLLPGAVVVVLPIQSDAFSLAGC